MYQISELYRPTTLPEALRLLRQGAKPLAGGTDILVKLRHDPSQALALMSVHDLSELQGVEELPNGDLSLGAALSFTELAESALIAARAPILAQAARSMGGPQIRNVATIGGNLVNGAVSADSAPSLCALDAVLEFASERGRRLLPLADFYAGPGKTHIALDELLTRIRVPLGGKARWGGVYLKMSTRKAMDIATLSAAAVCELRGDGRIAKAAIALGVAGPTPLRCQAAEEILTGQRLSRELLEQAGQAALAPCQPRSSWRASKEFREALIVELSARAFLQAYQQAGGEPL